MSILVKTAWSLRLAREADISALKNLIVLSSRGLRANYYSAAQIEGALGSVFGVDRQLVRDNTYFVVEHEGQLIGCGGWSKRKTLYGGDQWTGREAALLDPQHDAAKIRAFFIHPSWTRRGIGTMILEACENAAIAAGFAHFEMGATFTGLLLYQARGYVAIENLEVPLGNGESLPIVRLEKRIAKPLL